MNGYGKLRRMTDRNPAIVIFYHYLAATFVTSASSSSAPAATLAETPARQSSGPSDTYCQAL